MTVGVPVVVSRGPALLEVAPVGVSQVFDAASAEQLTSILIELIDHPAARQAQREAGWRQAQRFDWRTSADNLRVAWDKAIKARRMRHA
jgi:glycosyltransferase involved in cell wall biosynthesis